MRTHQELDDRSLALHRLIADKVRHDPALFDKARATLAIGGSGSASGHSPAWTNGHTSWTREWMLAWPWPLKTRSAPPRFASLRRFRVC